jgi:hypothetical protein
VVLPQITIERPRLRFWQWLALRMWPYFAGVVALVAFGIVRHNAGIVYAALITAGAVVLLAAIETPLVLGAVTRHERKLTQAWSLPPGTLFAAPGSQVGYLADAASGPAESRAYLRRGLLIIDRAGVRFHVSPGTGEPWDTSLIWPQVARVDAGPGRSPRSARISVVTTDGKTVTWRVDGLEKLITALDRLRQDQGMNTSPAAEIQPPWAR